MKTIDFQLLKDRSTSTITSPKVFEHEISANNVHYEKLTNQENNSDPMSSATTPYLEEDFKSLAQFAEKIYKNSLNKETQ